MWILLVPAAVGALSLISKAKTGSYNPAELLVQHPALPAGTRPIAQPGAGIAPGTVTPGAQPGLGTIDGHGTGVLLGNPVAGVPTPPPTSGAVQGLDPSDPNAAVIAAAAGHAAELAKQQIIAALNTPQADRTPEQAALVSGLASLPTT